MVMRTVALLTFALCASVLLADRSSDGGSAFQKRCTGCHGVDQPRIGPALRGVYGRRAGRAAGFPYSDALKASTITWEDATLDKWLTDPDSLIPGNDMALRLNDRSERAAIIEYLKQLK